MKKLIITALISLLPFLASAESLKVGVVNMGKAFDSYYKLSEGEKRFQESAAHLQEQIMEVQKELQTLVKDIRQLNEEAQNIALSEDARQEKMKEIEDKKIEGRRHEEDVQRWKTNFQREQMKFKVQMVDEIKTQLNALSEEKGIDLVLDASPDELDIAPVLYSQASYDLTEELIARINKDAPAE